MPSSSPHHHASSPASRARFSHEQAAAVPLAALTAWQTLVDTAHVQPGQRVLVHAAGGGVGHFAVQIAKHLGAQVIGTASSARHKWLNGLGADQLIDHTTVAFEDVLTDIDVVLDLVGDKQGNTSIRSLNVLRPGGLIIAVPGGVSPELAAAADAAAMRATPFLVEPDGTALAGIAELIDAGAIRVEVEEVFPLAEAGRAPRPRRIPPHPRQARPARHVLTPRPQWSNTNVYEIRRYQTRPGRREEWVRYMEDVVILYQQSKGMTVTAS
jgi:NADPH:quinone reductase-like Zn-dependent oxidoreductase